MREGNEGERIRGKEREDMRHEREEEEGRRKEDEGDER